MTAHQNHRQNNMQFPYNPSKDYHHATEDYGTASFTDKNQILQHLVEEP